MVVAEMPEVKKALSNKKDASSSGSECSFVDFGNGWGLKCYRNYGSYFRAYVVQQAAAKAGIAPQVGESHKIAGHYCYITQVIEPMCEYGYDNDHCVQDPECGQIYDSMTEANDEFYQEFGHVYYDEHWGNYGYMDGECVIIDFDGCFETATKIKDSGRPIEGLLPDPFMVECKYDENDIENQESEIPF